MASVGLIMGSTSDSAGLQPARDILMRFGVEFEERVISAHRTPRQAGEYAEQAQSRGIRVIIAAAGKAAHLAGAVAARSTLPVIGIPMPTSDLGGMDSLLSTVQMPTGVPVATVAIGGSANAALLAVEILALSDAALGQELVAYRADLAGD